MDGLRIDNPGPRSTVQDLGRRGYQHKGLSPGGAADLNSYRWANQLLDNDANEACLEITFGGFIATATAPLLLALTGADCEASVNDRPLRPWGCFFMASGDRLHLRRPATGLLSYLAVAGGWQTRQFCGSRSAVAREGLTGLGFLSKGEMLPIAEPVSENTLPAYLDRTVPKHLIPDMDSDAPFRVMPGPEQALFSHIDLTRFIHGQYCIGQQSDRMGYRLEGPPLNSPGGITSRAVCCGTVQVPGDGNPMVLLNDRQTIGGFPVLGVLPALECSRLAQKRPGQRLSFRWADIADCQSERLLFERLHHQMLWSAR